MSEYGIKSTDELVFFGQLYGMCDQVSFSLGKSMCDISYQREFISDSAKSSLLVDVDGSCNNQRTYLGVGGHPALSLHSSNELSQWL